MRLGMGLDSFALLAIPFFIIAGKVLNRCGIARRLVQMERSAAQFHCGLFEYVWVLKGLLCKRFPFMKFVWCNKNSHY